MMLTVANQRFVANGERRERFRQALLRSIAADKSESGKPVGWEPEDIRRERKRAEGLRRRDELLSQRQQQNQSAQKGDDAVVLGAFLEDQV
jgi:tRNA wybutosine-synthesizing protein 3